MAWSVLETLLREDPRWCPLVLAVSVVVGLTLSWRRTAFPGGVAVAFRRARPQRGRPAQSARSVGRPKPRSTLARVRGPRLVAAGTTSREAAGGCPSLARRRSSPDLLHLWTRSSASTTVPPPSARRTSGACSPEAHSTASHGTDRLVCPSSSPAQNLEVQQHRRQKQRHGERQRTHPQAKSPHLGRSGHQFSRIHLVRTRRAIPAHHVHRGASSTRHERTQPSMTQHQVGSTTTARQHESSGSGPANRLRVFSARRPSGPGSVSLRYARNIAGRRRLSTNALATRMIHWRRTWGSNPRRKAVALRSVFKTRRDMALTSTFTAPRRSVPMPSPRPTSAYRHRPGR